METNFILTDIKPTSQAHCWQLLLEGYHLKSVETNKTYYIFNNTLTCNEVFITAENFIRFDLFDVYIEQDWTDFLKDGPILCTALYSDDSPRIVALITNINSEGPSQDEWIYENISSFYKDAKPATLEELKPYLLEYRTGLLK